MIRDYATQRRRWDGPGHLGSRLAFMLSNMGRERYLRRGAVSIAVLCLVLTGCAGTGGTTITVFAASSLTDVMERLIHTYSATHPDTDFAVNYGSSTQLVQQLKSGANPAVLVTADQAAMEALEGTDLLSGEPEVIATNDITLALAPGNPAGIENLSDVAGSGITVARCAAGVPCGRATERVLENAGLQLERAAVQDSVRAVLTKVTTGQVDAGFVYTTDALAAGSQGVTSIELKNVHPNEYPAALTFYGSDNAGAVDFHHWLTGAETAGILREAGFGE